MMVDSEGSATRSIAVVTAPEPADAELEGAGYVGFIDAIEWGRVYGWAWNPQAPERRPTVDVFHGDQRIATVAADRHRSDLAEGGIGDGRHAFVLDLPPKLRGMPPHAFSAYFQDTRMPLGRGPRLAEIDRVPRQGSEEAVSVALAFRVDRIEATVGKLSNLVGALGRELRGQRSSIEEIRRDVLGDHALRELQQRFGRLAGQIEDQAKSLASLELFILRLDRQLKASSTRIEDLAAARRPGRLRAGARGFISRYLPGRARRRYEAGAPPPAESAGAEDGPDSNTRGEAGARARMQRSW